MKVLVLGARGQLGQCLHDQLASTLHEVVYTTRQQIDVCDFESTKYEIAKISPDVIINATAYTAVDHAEQDPETASLINHLAVTNLADISNLVDCYLIHISTDYVFDGASDAPYTESSDTNPQSVYGYTKLMGELSIRSSECKFLIIRTSWVFSEYGDNFLKTMLRLGAERKELSVVGDQIGCPTYAQDLAKAIVAVLPYLRDNKLASKLYHFSGNHCCSWFEFAEAIFAEARTVGLKTPALVRSIASSDFPTIAKRPIYSVMDGKALYDDFGIEQSDWQLGVHAAVSKMLTEKKNIS